MQNPIKCQKKQLSKKKSSSCQKSQTWLSEMEKLTKKKRKEINFMKITYMGYMDLAGLWSQLYPRRHD